MLTNGIFQDPAATNPDFWQFLWLAPICDSLPSLGARFCRAFLRKFCTRSLRHPPTSLPLLPARGWVRGKGWELSVRIVKIWRTEGNKSISDEIYNPYRNALGEAFEKCITMMCPSELGAFWKMKINHCLFKAEQRSVLQRWPYSTLNLLPNWQQIPFSAAMRFCVAEKFVFGTVVVPLLLTPSTSTKNSFFAFSLENRHFFYCDFILENEVALFLRTDFWCFEVCVSNLSTPPLPPPIRRQNWGNIMSQKQKKKNRRTSGWKGYGCVKL